MSIKDRLAKKTQDLVIPVKNATPTSSPTPMRTGPGQMLMVNSLMKESNEKVAFLEAKLKQFDSGLPTLLLDPLIVKPSKWANRISQSFDNAAFRQLKLEIAEAGGNVQPIKVRPKEGSDSQFEIVYGHRRHKACEELGLLVLALVEAVSDADLFKQMDRENRARADLAPWEQGVMYKQALGDRLFGSREQLARELGIDPGNLSKALRLAGLDSELVEAFASPLDLQYRWAKPLSDALIHDRQSTLEIARELANLPAASRSPKAVFDRLIGTKTSEVSVEQVRREGEIIAEVMWEGEKITVAFARGAVDRMGIDRLKVFISNGFK